MVVTAPIETPPGRTARRCRDRAVSGQWEPYVEPAAAELDPDVFDEADPHCGSLAYEFRREVACDTARRVLAVVGPLVAEDTRERMVAAAGRVVEREGCASTHPDASHIPCIKPPEHGGDHVSRGGRNWLAEVPR